MEVAGTRIDTLGTRWINPGSTSWQDSGSIEGIGRVAFQKDFRRVDRDSVRIAGMLHPLPPWQALLGTVVPMEATCAILVSPVDSSIRIRMDPIRSLRIRKDTPLLLDSGRIATSSSPDSWWELLPGSKDPALIWRSPSNEFMVEDGFSGVRLDSIVAMPRLRLSGFDTTRFNRTRKSSHGTIVLLTDSGKVPTSATGRDPLRASCDHSTKDELLHSYFDPCERGCRQFEFFRPATVESISTDRFGSKSLFDSNLIDKGFVAPYMRGYRTNRPVTLVASDLRLMVDLLAFPMPKDISVPLDSSSRGKPLVERIALETLPRPMANFWRQVDISKSRSVGIQPTCQVLHEVGTAPLHPGLPRVRMEGDISEWKSLESYVDSLSSFGPPHIRRFLPIFKELSRSAAGEASRPFWNLMIRGQNAERGWLNLFLGSASVMGVRLVDREPVGALFAGMTGIAEDPSDSSLSPRKIWIITRWKLGEARPYCECGCCHLHHEISF